MYRQLAVLCHIILQQMNEIIPYKNEHKGVNGVLAFAEPTPDRGIVISSVLSS